MIDYMQLMDNPGPESRQQQISEISRGIKAVARELNVPVIAPVAAQPRTAKAATATARA